MVHVERQTSPNHKRAALQCANQGAKQKPQPLCGAKQEPQALCGGSTKTSNLFASSCRFHMSQDQSGVVPIDLPTEVGDSMGPPSRCSGSERIYRGPTIGHQELLLSTLASCSNVAVWSQTPFFSQHFCRRSRQKLCRTPKATATVQRQQWQGGNGPGW